MIVIPFKKPEPQELKCSFCNKPKSQCAAFIKGLAGFICNKCVEQAKERLSES